MSKTKPATPATPATPAAKYALPTDATNATNTVATSLARADASFESVMTETARAVARLMGTEPTFDHWEAVAEAFQNAYRLARGGSCTEETARKRWVAVCGEMQTQCGQDKPRKPTAAAAAKSAQRATADEEAQKLIKRAKATTPQDILSIATKSKEPLTRGVLAALGKAATDKAAEATKGAAEAARVESKKLREQCLTTLAKMSKTQLTLALGAINAIADGRTVSIRDAKKAPAAAQQPAQQPANA